MRLTPSFPAQPHGLPRSSLLGLALILNVTPAHASMLLEVCRSTDSPLVCRLKSILTMLYTAAGILALLLLIAIATAIIIYRRNSRKL